MSGGRWRSRSRAAIALATALLAAGCSSIHFGSEKLETPPAEEKTGADALRYGQEADLRGIGGSAVFGKIRVIDRGDGAVVLASLMNVPSGNFRIAFHADPNCSSPNGFSAGPTWAPAGRRPEDLVPAQLANGEDRVEATVRVRGLHANGPGGVAGRSVIVYAGSKIEPIRPDVRNDAIACGVFHPATPLSF
jgi:Cu/Zn superoxide dismutase